MDFLKGCSIFVLQGRTLECILAAILSWSLQEISPPPVFTGVNLVQQHRYHACISSIFVPEQTIINWVVGTTTVSVITKGVQYTLSDNWNSTSSAVPTTQPKECTSRLFTTLCMVTCAFPWTNSAADNNLRVCLQNICYNKTANYQQDANCSTNNGYALEQKPY